MNTLFEVAEAGRARRWHSHPMLSDTNDFNDGHGARVALMALTLKPDLSRDGLIHALAHDLGERYVADVSYDAKKRLPEEMLRHLHEAEEQAVQEMIPQFRRKLDLPEGEAELILMCDWLDAYLWALKHAPKLTRRYDWERQRMDILHLAESWGYCIEVGAFFKAAEGEYL